MTKKYLIVLVLKLLEDANEYNPITQTNIAEIISSMVPCDRKTVGRNIKFLKEMGYPIIKTTMGYYMGNRTFSKQEREYILNSINLNPETYENKEKLYEKLKDFLISNYKR